MPLSAQDADAWQECPPSYSIFMTISPKAKCGWDVIFTGKVTVWDNAEIGSGSEIHGSCNIHEDVHLIGKVIVNPTSAIYKGARINNGSVLGRRNSIGPGAILGQRVITGFHCNINGIVGDDVHMGDGVNIAPGARVLEGLDMENDVCVEENADVLEHVGARKKVTRNGVEDAPPGNGKYVLKNGLCEVKVYTG